MCQDCKEIYPAFYADDKCEKCEGTLEMRQDDSNLDAIENRLDTYTNETLPVINGYIEEGRMIEINGEQRIEDVTSELMKRLEK